MTTSPNRRRRPAPEGSWVVKCPTATRVVRDEQAAVALLERIHQLGACQHMHEVRPATDSPPRPAMDSLSRVASNRDSLAARSTRGGRRCRHSSSLMRCRRKPGDR